MSLRFLPTSVVLASVVVAAAVANPARAETIKIGVTPGPHAQILEAVKPIAAKNGNTSSRRRSHRLPVLFAGELQGALLARREKRQQPVELVGKRCEVDAGRASSQVGALANCDDVVAVFT